MSDDGEFEQISDEEKLKIAQHYLLSSPPGQLQEVLHDVRKLLPDGLLTDSLATGIARVYNNRFGKVVQSPSGNKVVICTPGEIDATHYMDPISGTTFAIDHLTLAVTDDMIPVPAHMSGEAHNLSLYREAIQREASQYVAAHYNPAENAAASVYVAENSPTIIVHISGDRKNVRNFWSGRWNSVWSIEISGGSASISGDAKIHAHYFEDGNVQLQTAKSFAKKEIRSGSESEVAKAAIAFISNSESSLQEGLEGMYSTMNEETFRAMRRVMPITRTKMEWNVNAVRMVKQVRK